MNGVVSAFFESIEFFRIRKSDDYSDTYVITAEITNPCKCKTEGGRKERVCHEVMFDDTERSFNEAEAKIKEYDRAIEFLKMSAKAANIWATSKKCDSNNVVIG